MKLVIIVFICLFNLTIADAQSINVSHILREIYQNKADWSILKEQKINYIVPQFMNFIDTSRLNNFQKEFKVNYYPNGTAFEKYLMQAHNAVLLNIYYEQLAGNEIVIILEMSKTDDKQYFGAYKFSTFIDKRKVRLVFNKSKSEWTFRDLVKLYDEPTVGHD